MQFLERLEHLFAIFRLDADAVVGHAERPDAATAFRRYRDQRRHAVAAELDGIADQEVEQLQDLIGVAHQPRQGADLEPAAGLTQLVLHQEAAMIGDLLRIDGHVRGRESVQPGKRQQALHHRLEPLAIIDDLGQQRAILVVGEGALAFAQQARELDHQSGRRAQVVRHDIGVVAKLLGQVGRRRRFAGGEGLSRLCRLHGKTP